MPKPWDDKGARDVAPSSDLANQQHPTLGSYESTIASPLPLCIAVRILEGKPPRPLPLIFISEHVAKIRQVPAGWYISAEVGQRFDVVITNVHKKGAVHFRGEKIESNEVVACGVLFVDGTKALLKG